MLSPYSGNSAVDSTCLGQWTPVEDLRFGSGESGTYKVMLSSEWLEAQREEPVVGTLGAVCAVSPDGACQRMARCGMYLSGKRRQRRGLGESSSTRVRVSLQLSTSAKHIIQEVEGAGKWEITKIHPCPSLQNCVGWL
jgi:hypothetical protein